MNLTAKQNRLVLGTIRMFLDNEEEVINDCVNYEFTPSDVRTRCTEFNELLLIPGVVNEDNKDRLIPYTEEDIQKNISRLD